MYKLMLSVRRFLSVQFDFSMNNTRQLYDGLCEQDQKKFMFDADKVNFSTNFELINSKFLASRLIGVVKFQAT
jgi:hypothetical protein